MNELKGRHAVYFTGDKKAGVIEKQIIMTLASIKTNWGSRVAQEILSGKVLQISNSGWFELVLLPGEKDAEDTRKEKLTFDLCRALYGDLRESYSGLTLFHVREEVDKLLVSGEPVGIIQMWAQPYVIKMGLLRAENTTGNKTGRGK